MIPPSLTLLLLFAAVATAGTVSRNNKVLVLMPSQAFLRFDTGRLFRIGTTMDELVIPAMDLVAAGFDLHMATPQGNKPPIDPRSNSSSYFGGNETWYRAGLHFWDTYPSLQRPMMLTQLAVEDPDAPLNATLPLLDEFAAVFVPGGHAPIIDLMSSTAVGRILVHLVQRDKPIGCICHGPLALVAASLVTSPWPFAGKNMTVFSTEEEKIVQKKYFDDIPIGLYPPMVLRALGGVTHEMPGFGSHVVVDGNLVTGQNPASAEEFGQALIKVIVESQQRG